MKTIDRSRGSLPAGVRSPQDTGARWIGALVVVLAGIATAACFLLVAPSARAAVPDYQVFEVPSPQPQEGGFFGERLRTLGDVDRDGARDVLISSSRFDAAGDHGGVITNAGRLYVFSGRTRAVLHTIDPPAPQEGASFGFWSANLGSDVDDDGVADFVTSAPGQVIDGETLGQVYVYSGATGTLIRTISPPEPFGTTGRFGGDFGGNLIGPGDLSGDGIGDFVATASGSFGGRGAAYAFDGKTGELLYKVSNPSTQDSALGFGAAEVGDVNGDGFGDYQVGAPRFDEGEGESAVVDSGRSYIIDGDTGDVIYTLINPEPEAGARFGQADADGLSLGDITGDGTPDIYVDSFLADESSPDAGPPLENAGKVFLFDGATGDLIRRLRSPAGPEAGRTFGASNASAGDIDRDGRPDSIVSSRGGNNGRATIFGGLNLGSVLKVFEDPGNQVGALFGSSISSPGDVNGDALPDYFISARRASVSGVEDVGTAYAFVSQTPPTPAPPGGGGPPVPACPQGTSAGVTCTVADGKSVITGTAGDDTIVGSDEDDVIDGGGGDDRIDGGDGDDSIDCGPGDDTVSGGDGDDEIDCGAGKDTVDGDAGKDSVGGGDGADKVQGGSGNDGVSGNAGDDGVSGNSGNDRVFGRKGDDKVFGRKGNDRALGGGGKDRVLGGQGNDRISGQDGADRVAGQAGNDEMFGGGGSDTMFGGTGNDEMFGRSGDDTMFGRAGNDRMFGNKGNDRLFGNRGNDLLVPGSGRDPVVRGGPGRDRQR